MKKLIRELQKKWAKYVLEMIAVTLGILGAFYLDNWNQERLDNRLTYDYLKRLQEDFSADRDNLESEINSLDWRYEQLNKLMPYLLDSLPASDMDINLFFTSAYRDHFMESDNTFQDLVNNGRMDLFEQNELKHELFELYALYDELNSYEEVVLEDNRLYVNSPLWGNHDLQKLMLHPGSKISVNEAERILSDAALRNGYYLYRINIPNMKNLYQECLEKIAVLDSMLLSQLQCY